MWREKRVIPTMRAAVDTEKRVADDRDQTAEQVLAQTVRGHNNVNRLLNTHQPGDLLDAPLDLFDEKSFGAASTAADEDGAAIFRRHQL